MDMWPEHLRSTTKKNERQAHCIRSWCMRACISAYWQLNVTMPIKRLPSSPTSILLPAFQIETPSTKEQPVFYPECTEKRLVSFLSIWTSLKTLTIPSVIQQAIEYSSKPHIVSRSY